MNTSASERASLLRQWERFWFAKVPSEGFAAVRIAVGTAGLISLLGFTPVALFWSPDGIAPLPGGGTGFRMFVLSSGFGVAVGWVYFLGLLVSFTCMALGLFTATAVASSFIGTLVQARWNALPLTSGHGVLLSLLFCLVWSDCGARLSIDRWRSRRRGLETAPSTSIVQATGDHDALQPIWPLRLIRAQVVVVYATSGLFKLLGPAWRDGTAIHYAIGQNIYGRVFHAYPFPSGFDWVLTVLTYGTLAWELAFPLLLLNRITRAMALWTGVAMHLGIWTTMEVGPFTWVMLASYVAFLDPHQVQQWLDSRRAPASS